MNSKILNHMKRITVVTMIVILCSATTVNAFSIDTSRFSGGTSYIRSFFEKIFKTEKEFTLEDLKAELEKMKESRNIRLAKIKELINKLKDSESKDLLTCITKMFEGFNIGDLNFDFNLDLDLSGLLDKLLNSIGSLLGGGSSIEADITETMQITAQTALDFTKDQKYAVKLNATIYMHDTNGDKKPDTNKWAVLVHPFMLSGTAIASSVGPYYYENGYNIIAPDLRGFGDSEGSVALGFLESLDVYDWIVKLNEVYEPEKVIVHGVSLGAATTNFLSGIDKFVPVEGIKSLKELNVIGLVEDCGYIKMEDFASKNLILGLGIGLTKENFDTYGNATKSLENCEVPMMIIHGDADTMVKVQNAHDIEKILKDNGTDVEKHIISGGAHALVILGGNEEYKTYVEEFIEKCESKAVTSEGELEESDDNLETVEEDEETKKINDIIKKYFEMLYRW